MTAVSEDTRMTWFTRAVTVGLIIGCNALLVLGWWLSGVNLEAALSKPRIYDPESNYCVTVKWTKVIGVDQPMKVCTEWLDVADPSGSVHTIRYDQALTVGTDGHLYYEGQRDEDVRLAMLVIFVIVVIGAGMWLKHYLVKRYSVSLENAKER